MKPIATCALCGAHYMDSHTCAASPEWLHKRVAALEERVFKTGANAALKKDVKQANRAADSALHELRESRAALEVALKENAGIRDTLSEIRHVLSPMQAVPNSHLSLKSYP